MACEHGIHGDGWGCQICRPLLFPGEEGRAPILPRFSDHKLRREVAPEIDICTLILETDFSAETLPELPTPETKFANKKAPGSCPDCGSTIHYVDEGKSGWICADCGTKYKAPPTKRQNGNVDAE